jgi:hypothetical protein
LRLATARPSINDIECALHPARPKQQAFPLVAVWKSFGGLTELRDPMLKLILGGTVAESPATLPVMLR